MELLTVLGIMALLMSVGLPGLLSSLRGSSLTQAGNQLADISILARQVAMSHNTMTALLLITNDPQESNLSGRAISVWELASDQSWTQVSNWSFLPDATKAYDDPTVVATTLPGTTSSINIKGRALDASSYAAFVFTPEGAMYGMSAASRVASVQYISDAPPTKSINTNLKNYYDLVFTSDTGAVHVVRP